MVTFQYNFLLPRDQNHHARPLSERGSRSGFGHFSILQHVQWNLVERDHRVPLSLKHQKHFQKSSPSVASGLNSKPPSKKIFGHFFIDKSIVVIFEQIIVIFELKHQLGGPKCIAWRYGTTSVLWSCDHLAFASCDVVRKRKQQKTLVYEQI